MQIACWPPRPGFHPLLPSQTRSLTPPGEGGEAAGPPGTPLPPPRSGQGPLGSPLSAPLRRRGKASPEQRGAARPSRLTAPQSAGRGAPLRAPSARGPSAVATGMRLSWRLFSVEKKKRKITQTTATHLSTQLSTTQSGSDNQQFQPLQFTVLFPHPPTLQTRDPNNFCPVSSPECRLSLFTTRPGQKFSDGTFLSENHCVFRSRCFAERLWF